MSADKTSGDKGRMGDVLEKLLEYRDKEGHDDKSILIMLGLLNLLGIVGILNARTVTEISEQPVGSGLEQMPSDPITMLINLLINQNKGQGFNPASLLSILSNSGFNKDGVSGLDPVALLGLLGNILGGISGGGLAPQVPNVNANNKPAQKKADKLKVEKNVKVSKGNQHVGKKNGLSNQPELNTKSKAKGKEILKWDFEDRKKT